MTYYQNTTTSDLQIGGNHGSISGTDHFAPSQTTSYMEKLPIFLLFFVGAVGILATALVAIGLIIWKIISRRRKLRIWRKAIEKFMMAGLVLYDKLEE